MFIYESPRYDDDILERIAAPIQMTGVVIEEDAGRAADAEEYHENFFRFRELSGQRC